MINFENITNKNDLSSLLLSTTDVLHGGNIYGIFILVSVFIIIFISLGTDKKSFSAACFSTMLIALLLVSLGWVSTMYYLICIVLFIISIMVLYFND
jgi:hypothetical protein